MKATEKLAIKKAIMDASILLAVIIPICVAVGYMIGAIKVNALYSVAATLTMYFLLFVVAEPLKRTRKSDFALIVKEENIDSDLAELFAKKHADNKAYDAYKILDLITTNRNLKELQTA